MHDDHTLIEQRLDRVLRERVRPAIHGAAVPLTVERWDAPGEPVPVDEALRAVYRATDIGDTWGRPWATTWFRLSGDVPADWAGSTVEAIIDLGVHGDQPGFSAEGLVYTPTGAPVKGIHPYSTWVRVSDKAGGGEPVALLVEAAANPRIQGPVTPLGDVETAGDAPLYRLVRADLAIFHTVVWELVQDLDVLSELMHELPLTEPRRWEILRAIGRALDALDLSDIAGSAPAARAELRPALDAPAHASAHRVSAVGHAHIDSAWLWPLRETIRKVARTAANVTALMDDHPEFVFAMSQAQQLAWIKEHRPEIYARVKQKVADGQFVPVGGMWVESDTNMPGGEALARQFVYGKRFFLDEFGIDTPEVWLPDSFGYSAALPQLVKLSGSRWFLTQKISWSETNKFPHHTFWWEGIDGTRVFTHFPPVDTYNGKFSGQQMAHLVRNFAEKGDATRSLVPFGFGDGGGGPTREMLARAARLRDLEGSARVEIEPPERFFTKAAAEYQDAPVWVGELYLELHRATYTTQAKIKQGNRRSEALLREAELWSATAATRRGTPYPYDELDDIWRTVLLHQFHDILPGSSIAWVNREARDTYAEIARRLETIIDTATRALATADAADAAGDTAPGDDAATPGTVVFNAAPHTRDNVPALGAAPATSTSPARRPVSVTALPAGGWLIDNGPLRVTIDPRGLVTSVIDTIAGRETIAPDTPANLLQLHPDLPNHWDAWDVDAFYRNRVTDLTEADEITVIGEDTATATVRVSRHVSASHVTQTLTLRAGERRLDFETEVDWHEAEAFLKVAFPLDLRTERFASETQFGHVYRATHTNTTWDAAKFEVCAHRWLHVGEPDWGAALANDSTYGHDVTRDVRPDGGTTTTVRLSLLRAPRFPDPHTDQGHHRFGYALVPGAGIADAVREGYRVNLPARTVPGRARVEPLISTTNDAVVVEAVKLADDRSGDVVARLYEAHGTHATTVLRSGLPLAGAVVTDLLERPLGPALDSHDDEVRLRLRPFEIVTVRLRRA